MATRLSGQKEAALPEVRRDRSRTFSVFTKLYFHQFGGALPTRAATLLGNLERRRGYRSLVFCKKAPGISRNLFPKSVNYVDGRRTGHESCTNLEHCIDIFANDKMRFALRINAAACKLRDAESNYLARFQC